MRDFSDRPIRDAIVRAHPIDAVARTDSLGNFRIANVGTGQYTVVVTKVGYRPDTAVIDVRSVTARPIVFRLERLDVLDPVVIRSTRDLLPRVVDRERRKLGAVIYADEIQRLGMFSVKDLLLFAPRIAQVAGDQPVVFVDGRLLRHPEDMPRPEDIAAIEAHRGLMGVRESDLWMPTWMNYSTRQRIVLIWTNWYVAEQERRQSPLASARR